MRRWWWLGLFLTAGCARCGSNVPVDAGQPLVRSTDVRSALLLVYPENRGATIREGRATLTRFTTGAADWPGELRAALTRAHLTAEDAGIVGGTNGPFHVALQEVKDGTAQLQFWLPVSDENVEKLYGAQVSISTAEMALYFPRDPKLTVVGEHFDVDLTYLASTEQRAAFLARQALQLLERSSVWQFVGPKPWGDDGGVPDVFEAQLTNDQGDQYRLSRRGAEVTIRFHIVTFARK